MQDHRSTNSCCDWRSRVAVASNRCADQPDRQAPRWLASDPLRPEVFRRVELRRVRGEVVDVQAPMVGQKGAHLAPPVDRAAILEQNDWPRRWRSSWDGNAGMSRPERLRGRGVKRPA